MDVWVVMGNDFPDSVYLTEQAAESFVFAKKERAKKDENKGFRQIYWRTYKFEVQP